VRHSHGCRHRSDKPGQQSFPSQQQWSPLQRIPVLSAQAITLTTANWANFLPPCRFLVSGYTQYRLHR